MADIRKLAPFILKWEGAFSNDPLDSGGATMKGITLATYKAYRKEKGLSTPTIEDLKKISDLEWMTILKEKYWNPWQADRIGYQPVANLLVDWGWGSGPATAIKQFQGLVRLHQDGIAGNQTLSAINNYPDKTELFNRIMNARKDFYVAIIKQNPAQIKFLSGWLNRLYDSMNNSFNLVEK